MKVKGIACWLTFVSMILWSIPLIGHADTGVSGDISACITRTGSGSPYSTAGKSYFSDDFESGLGNWVVSGKDWAVTTAVSRGGKYSATDSPDGNYLANTDASMILAGSIDLSAATSPILIFWHKFGLTTGYGSDDFAYVDISTDGGFTWSNVQRWGPGTIATWQLVQIDLNESKYKVSDLKIRFRLTSDGANQGDGWYIDDLEIKDNNPPPPITPTPTPSPTPTSSPTPSPSPSPTASPTPTPSPTVTPTPECEAESITALPKKLNLKIQGSGDVVVAVTGKDDCLVEGNTVTATITSGRKRISVSPATQETDVNGQAVFTITATDKTGNAKIIFKDGNLKTKVKVKVVKLKHTIKEDE